MILSFQNIITLITGASRGIGAAAARLFAESGGTVIVHYHSDEQAAQTVLASLPGENHLAIRAEMADPEDLRVMVAEVMKRYGRIDILVNNAGIYEEHEMISLPEDDFLAYWERNLSVNLSGPAFLAFLVSKEMQKADGGRIVNVTSRGAFRGEPTSWAYGAAKAGLNAVGQSMAKALAPYGIYVFTLAPGFVDTDMTIPCLKGDRRGEIEAQSPLNRIASPEEIARAILLLAAEGNEYMTGCVLDMNGASYLRT